MIDPTMSFGEVRSRVSAELARLSIEAAQIRSVLKWLGETDAPTAVVFKEQSGRRSNDQRATALPATHPPAFYRGPMTIEKAREIRRLFESGARQVDLAALFHTNRQAIFDVVRNLRWTDPSPAPGRKPKVHLSESDRAALRSAVASGAPQHAVAADFGVSTRTVANIVVAAPPTPPAQSPAGDFPPQFFEGPMTLSKAIEVRRLHNAGVTQPDLARQFHCPLRTIFDVVHGNSFTAEKRSYVVLTAAQRAEVHKLRAEGLSQKTIADRFGVYRTTISDVLKVPPPVLPPPSEPMRSTVEAAIATWEKKAEAPPPPPAPPVVSAPKEEPPAPNRAELNRLYPGITADVLRLTNGRRAVLFAALEGREREAEEIKRAFEFASVEPVLVKRGDTIPGRKLRDRCAAHEVDFVLDIFKHRSSESNGALKEIAYRGVPVVTLARGHSVTGVLWAIKEQLLSADSTFNIREASR